VSGNMDLSGGGGVSGGDSYFQIPIVIYLDGTPIYRNMIARMGRDAALKGLRTPN